MTVSNSVSELKKRVKEAAEAERKAAQAPAPPPAKEATPDHTSSVNSAANGKNVSSTPYAPPPAISQRQDSSPIKPLESIFNTSKLLSSPHTSEQISALWTAYHASRSGGTGRGFMCAALPVSQYETLMSIAKRYPNFVIPVPRLVPPQEPPSQDESAKTKDEMSYEFYYLQWDFHAPPPAPKAKETDLFDATPSSADHSLPPATTVLFTPLQEYKLRASFATPYLVLTFYPDLAKSHGLVLLRGEITPSAATAAGPPGGDPSERFMLSQGDAQLLAMGLQKFYLWGEAKTGHQEGEAGQLLQAFHEKPEEFKWEDLLKHATLA